MGTTSTPTSNFARYVPQIPHARLVTQRPSAVPALMDSISMGKRLVQIVKLDVSSATLFLNVIIVKLGITITMECVYNVQKLLDSQVVFQKL